MRWRRHGFDPWVRKIPWRRAWQLTPVFLPAESHGQRSLVGYSPWGRTESDMTYDCAGTRSIRLVSGAPWSSVWCKMNIVYHYIHHGGGGLCCQLISKRNAISVSCNLHNMYRRKLGKKYPDILAVVVILWVVLFSCLFFCTFCEFAKIIHIA